MRAFIAKPEHGIAWVTGASSGIGFYVAQRLVRQGWSVAVTARNREALEKLEKLCSQKKGHIIVKPCDVSNSNAMQDLLEELINNHDSMAMGIFNAGIYRPVQANQLKVADFKKSFDTNVLGVANGLVPLIDHMKQKGRGQIAITSSVAGYSGLPTSAVYGATKAALTNMAESLKFDLDKMNIHIQIVHPGFVDTPATKSNPFPMPFLMKVEKAADQFTKGLNSSRFEITFPKRFNYLLKILNILPYALYFRIVNAITGWKKRKI